MLSKQINLSNYDPIQLNPLLMPIHFLSDSENPGTEAVEEKQTSALRKFYEDLIEPYNDAIKSGSEAAIASYLKCLKQEEVSNQTTVQDVEKVQNIEKVQKHVIETLQSHLSYNKRISVVNDCRAPCTCCYVIPPYLLQKVHQTDQIREDHLIDSIPAHVKPKKPTFHSKVRHLTERVNRRSAQRANPEYQASGKVALTNQLEAHAFPGKEPSITIYDAQYKEKLPGRFVASNTSRQKAIKKDKMAKKVLKAATDVHEFWLKNFNLNSFDDKGTEIRSTIHFGKNFANAFWNGKQMVFGDGDKYLSNFADLSVVGHEFGHAVTGNKLNYQGEAGALNEHLSDVWGSLIEQYKKKQTANQADWLIGKGVIKVDGQRFPLRSMKAPGTAYYSPQIGQDPQPSHYSQRYTGLEDNGGVHINSGIPNKAFYLFADAQGGHAWEKAGRLWYLTIQSNVIHPNCSMHEFAQTTIYTALQHYPHDYKMHQDLAHAWQTVGLV